VERLSGCLPCFFQDFDATFACLPGTQFGEIYAMESYYQTTGYHPVVECRTASKVVVEFDFKSFGSEIVVITGLVIKKSYTYCFKR
jgi:hypothetical protein